MKKLIFLVIPALVLMLAGCSKAETEDKEQKTRESRILKHKKSRNKTGHQQSKRNKKMKKPNRTINQMI